MPSRVEEFFAELAQFFHAGHFKSQLLCGAQDFRRIGRPLFLVLGAVFRLRSEFSLKLSELLAKFVQLLLGQRSYVFDHFRLDPGSRKKSLRGAFQKLAAHRDFHRSTGFAAGGVDVPQVGLPLGRLKMSEKRGKRGQKANAERIRFLSSQHLFRLPP